MAKGDAADRLSKLRKRPDFSPSWSYHALKERLPEYEHLGLDMPSIERIVRSGKIGVPEMNLKGLETVHVTGTVDELTVAVVVCPKTSGGEEFAEIVTIKPK